MEEILQYGEILRKSPLFSGMDDAALPEAVTLLGGKVAAYEKGAMLHRPGTRLYAFGLVLSGSVQACCDAFDGSRIIMAEVQPGVTFGEALCFLQIPDSPVYIYTPGGAAVLWLSPDGLYGGNPLAADLQKRFAVLLASRTLAMNRRIQILSRLSIRDRLIVYLSEMEAGSGSDTFRIPLSREDLAAYIGANRSALSRELSAMKKDGILDFHKNTFTLLKHVDF